MNRLLCSIKLRVLVAGVAVLLSVMGVAQPAEGHDPRAGFTVSDGRILDANGHDFVMRGANHGHAWFTGEMRALADISAVGANAVRVVLSTGALYQRTTEAEVEAIVERCRQYRLVCVLAVHDTTGFGQADGAIELSQAVDYWLSLQPILLGSEDVVIVNVGNEPFGNGHESKWRRATIDAVRRLRTAGVTHALMVDAPNWGQDWTFTMRDQAASVLEADPLGNLIFDVHMYGVYNTEAKVKAYVESFVVDGLPLVIGEFGQTHTDGNPVEDAIMRWAADYGIGYLGWSWSGNTDPVADLNVVEAFDPAAMTIWGERLIYGDDGIAASSIRASTYGGRDLRRPPLREVAQLPGFAAKNPEPHRHDRVEAEHGLATGVGVAVKGAGFAGDGYVNGFDLPGDTLMLTVYVDHAGTYDLVFGYRAPFGDKHQHIVVNNVNVGDAEFLASDTFTTTSLRNVELVEGSNAVSMVHYWGWIDFDFVEVWSDF